MIIMIIRTFGYPSVSLGHCEVNALPFKWFCDAIAPSTAHSVNYIFICIKKKGVLCGVLVTMHIITNGHIKWSGQLLRYSSLSTKNKIWSLCMLFQYPFYYPATLWAADRSKKELHRNRQISQRSRKGNGYLTLNVAQLKL